MENRCVCCGAIIPEGRQVCPKCEAGNVPEQDEEQEKIAQKERIGRMKGYYVERKVNDCSEKEKMDIIRYAVQELLQKDFFKETRVNFDTMQIIVHESDGTMTIGIKFERE